MELFYRHYGEGPALIILHGLYGASDNWVSIGRELANDFEVFIPDQRNHGNSPHTEVHNYQVLTEDLLNFMDSQKINKTIILGHSMGGKTGMFFAASYPERVQSLIVVDISPRAYNVENQPSPHTLDHAGVMKAMLETDLSFADSRMDIDMMLADKVKSQRVRQFLLKNITRKDKSTFKWKINLQGLSNNLEKILDGLDPEKIDPGSGITGFPVLFIKGENSDYISDPDYPLIHKIFPTAEIVPISNAGHWVHAEQPDLFVKNIRYFLKS